MIKQIIKMPTRSVQKHPAQGELALVVDRQVEADGIGMGVLSDGTPFLNQRGLALLCDVRNKYIGEISADWSSQTPNPRTFAIKQALASRGKVPEVAAYETRFGNVKVLAYPDEVCMAILEHFAFDANWAGKETALANFRLLARQGLRSFIYDKVGYRAEPEHDLWKVFKDRVSLTYDAVPEGRFGVFKELSSLIVTLGLAGLHIDEKFVPDISVGKAWAKHWTEKCLAERFGERSAYAHYYPPYFPQSVSNPQMAACYPEDALGEFRRWFRQDYIGDGGFRRYLTRKVNEKLLPEGYVQKALIALMRE